MPPPPPPAATPQAFDTPDNPYLPENVLWRQKEQFSDGEQLQLGRVWGLGAVGVRYTYGEREEQPAGGHPRPLPSITHESLHMRTPLSQPHGPLCLTPPKPVPEKPPGVGYSWIDGLKAHAEEIVSDSQLAAAHHRYPDNTPRTKEAYMYRTIFEGHFPQKAAADTVPGRWAL